MPEGVSKPLGHLAGIALVALGIASLPSAVTGSHRKAVLGLLVYNVGTAGLLTWVGIATPFRGVLLWPAVVLHAAVMVALLSQSFQPGVLDASSKPPTDLRE